mgnify:CR=1 FL=1|tara:strand:- start:4595 stop:5245 length:651 start_codon:yes stop_codon:yes gene_type:complete
MNDNFFKGFEELEQEEVVDSDVLKRINTLLKFKGIDSHDESSLESLKEFYKSNNTLTLRQFNTLSQLENKISIEAQEKYEKWCSEYTEEKRIKAIICAKYYRSNPPYFSSVIDKILLEEDYIPTESKWKSLCENRYAAKVLEATFSEPLYEIGSMVEGRKNAPIEYKGRLFSVMATDARPVINAAKGAKIYLLLPFNGGPVIECEERYIKKTKQKK